MSEMIWQPGQDMLQMNAGVFCEIGYEKLFTESGKRYFRLFHA